MNENINNSDDQSHRSRYILAVYFIVFILAVVFMLISIKYVKSKPIAELFLNLAADFFAIVIIFIILNWLFLIDPQRKLVEEIKQLSKKMKQIFSENSSNIFKATNDAGIIGIYKDREETQNHIDAVKDLRQAFMNHHFGEVKIIGVSLRVFFHYPGHFHDAIRSILDRAKRNSNITLKALLLHPESPEYKNRLVIESSGTRSKGAIVKDVEITIENINNLCSSFGCKIDNFGFYNESPYCTLVIFPEKCFYSPNILSDEVPVRLPMLIFHSNSHAYKQLNNFFEIIWKRKIDL